MFIFISCVNEFLSNYFIVWYIFLVTILAVYITLTVLFRTTDERNVKMHIILHNITILRYSMNM